MLNVYMHRYIYNRRRTQYGFFSLYNRISTCLYIQRDACTRRRRPPRGGRQEYPAPSRGLGTSREEAVRTPARKVTLDVTNKTTSHYSYIPGVDSTKQAINTYTYRSRKIQIDIMQLKLLPYCCLDHRALFHVSYYELSAQTREKSFLLFHLKGGEEEASKRVVVSLQSIELELRLYRGLGEDQGDQLDTPKEDRSPMLFDDDSQANRETEALPKSRHEVRLQAKNNREDGVVSCLKGMQRSTRRDYRSQTTEKNRKRKKQIG